jgi:PleD family two-component response regulator
MTVLRARILAIDDTPVNLMTLGAVLEGEFELQFATSGPAGIALALKCPPDLILLDVMMPEVDGFETFKLLRARPALQHIPVVFVTALNDVDSEVTGLSLGAADYITKPINVAIARHRIRNLIEREQLRKEVQTQRDQLQEEVALRKQSEDMLRKLSVAVEQSPASIVITNLDASLEYVNPRFTEVTGYSSAEVLGKNPRVLQSGLTP